jgi:hypothetical protein
VLPAPVAKPLVTPTAATKTIIRWTGSDNADSYSVLLNSKKVCTTTLTSCSIRKLVGPTARIEVVSNGQDRTFSQRVRADFKQLNPVIASRVFSSTTTKSALTKNDIKSLEKVVALIKTQGFSNIVISQITTTRKTVAKANARIELIKKYIDTKSGSSKINFEVVPAATRTYFNNIFVKG